MLRTLTLLLSALALATPAFSQTQPPALDGVEWTLTDGNGGPLPVVVTAKFTVTDPFNGTLEGEVSANGGVIERPTLTPVMDGFYLYENPAKGTHGFVKWNPAGYYEVWTDYNGGTERRMYAP